MEKMLNEGDFDSNLRQAQIAFEDRETDMSDFNFYLLNELPS